MIICLRVLEAFIRNRERVTGDMWEKGGLLWKLVIRPGGFPFVLTGLTM